MSAKMVVANHMQFGPCSNSQVSSPVSPRQQTETVIFESLCARLLALGASLSFTGTDLSKALPSWEFHSLGPWRMACYKLLDSFNDLLSGSMSMPPCVMSLTTALLQSLEQASDPPSIQASIHTSIRPSTYVHIWSRVPVSALAPVRSVDGRRS